MAEATWTSGPLRMAPLPGTVWLLRTCAPDGRSYRDFRWPLVAGAVVTAPDWRPEPVCGGGLHGLLRGCGAAGLLGDVDDAWLVIEAEAASVVDLGDKAKVPSATVIAVGPRDAAVSLIEAAYPDAPVVYARRTAGDRGTATAGDWGTATAGDRGTVTVGAYGTATAGYLGTVCVRWWDGARYRLAVGYVGEDGIEAGVPYHVVDGRLVRREPAETTEGR